MKVYTSLELTEKALQIQVINERGEFLCILYEKPEGDEDTADVWLPLLEQRCGENVYKYFSGDKGFDRWNSISSDITARRKFFKLLFK